MKPKYKLHQQITELSQLKLPPIYPDQIKWGQEHCLDKLAHLSRGKMYCLECGHSWKPENNRKFQVCPECNNRLINEKDYRSYRIHAAYFAVVTVCEGFQVVRMIWVNKVLKMNSPAKYFGKEVMQHWIDEKGGHTTMSLPVNGLSQAADSWIFSGEMKIKEPRGYGYSSTHFRHHISPYKTFPKTKILPVFKRNGFKGNFHHISPIAFLHSILYTQHFETLLKAKQFNLLGLCKDGGIYGRTWSSVKICIRNKYIVKDAKTWVDYIELLRYFDKDLHNAHYVCPKNLNAEHDRLVKKKREIQQKQKIETLRKKIAIDQSEFEKQKGKFFNLIFVDGSLVIRPLKTVEEFMKEGDELHHCVFTNEYYKKPDSLIMSARIDDKPIETIEVSLKSLDVVQSRGLHNNPTEYHDQILNIVRKNISVIKSIKSVKTNKKIAV